MEELNGYYQILPLKVFQNLDTINELLQPEIKGYCPDCLKEIISIIACHVQKADGCAPLQMETLKKLVPQAGRYLTGLIDAGIIVREGRYIPGVLSYKYHFAPEYESQYMNIKLENNKLIRRIKRVYEEGQREAGKKIRGYNNQVRYLKGLTINDEFKEYLNSYLRVNALQYNNALASAFRIINKDIFYSIDSTSGRFHSNLTNMAKGLRGYLRINGEPLVNIDVKNSQPYLSTIILTNPGKVSWLTENPAFALLLQTLKVSINQDVKNYINLVASGQLYEYLMQEFSKEGPTLTRDETKLQVLRILFARNRKPKNEVNAKCRQIFKDIFPTVHRKFSKVRGSARGDKFSNYKRFAILLQRIEAYLMLDLILKRIYRELPGTIAVTIHDSIMTGILTNNVEAARKIITEELTNFTGISPKIQIEDYRDKNRKEERRNTLYNQYDATTFVTLN